MVWPEDVPPELATQMAKPQLKVVPTAKRPKRKRLVAVPEPSDSDPGLEDPPDRQIGGQAHAESQLEPDEAADQKSDELEHGDGEGGGKKLPPYLRVIK
jgi:hypothetical protein